MTASAATVAPQDLHADRQSSLAGLEPALPPDIAQRAPFAQGWRACQKTLQAGIYQAAIET